MAENPKKYKTAVLYSFGGRNRGPGDCAGSGFQRQQRSL